MEEHVISSWGYSEPKPFPFEEMIALIRQQAAERQAQQPAEPERIPIENPRYVVQAGHGLSYAIIDTTGKDAPYVIGESNNDRRHVKNEASRKRTQEFNRKVAEDWAYTWNLAENGYCGLCKRKISEIPGYQPGTNGEPPQHEFTFGHRMYRRLCFYCSCSQDD
jgi:hypothetical protein